MDPDPYWRALPGVLVRGSHTHWHKGTLRDLLPLFFLSSLLLGKDALWPPALVLALSLPINNRSLLRPGLCRISAWETGICRLKHQGPWEVGPSPSWVAGKEALLTAHFLFPSVTDKNMAGKKPQSSRASQHQVSKGGWD